MKQPISRYTTRNTLMAPIGAVLAADVPHIDAQPSLHTHLLAQHLAMALGTVVLPGYAWRDQPGCDQDWGGDIAPFPFDKSEADYGQVLLDSGLGIAVGDLDTPDFHGPYLVKGCTSPRVAMVFVAEHCSTETCECIAVSLWLAWPESDLLLNDARGTFIPRDFARGFLCLTTNEDDARDCQPPVFVRVDDLRIDDAKPVALYQTDDGTAMCEWVPGTFTDVPKPGHDVCRVPDRGHVLNFYDEAAVDSRWEFDARVLDYITEICDPDSEYYWESWDYVMKRCHARLQVVGCTFVDGVQQETFAEFDGHLEQNGDLWLVFSAR